EQGILIGKASIPDDIPPTRPSVGRHQHFLLRKRIRDRLVVCIHFSPPSPRQLSFLGFVLSYSCFWYVSIILTHILPPYSHFRQLLLIFIHIFCAKRPCKTHS